jgi:hypothetical protein
MPPSTLSDVFGVLIDRADLTLEEARNVAHACSVNLSIFRAQGDSLLAHLRLYGNLQKDISKTRSPCIGGCGRITVRRFPLYPHAGPLCRRCKRSDMKYHTIDYTTARRRFYLSREDLDEVPSIMRYLNPDIRCRYFRPADLLAVALRKHGGREGLRARRGLGLKRREAALTGIRRRRERLERERADGVEPQSSIQSASMSVISYAS